MKKVSDTVTNGNGVPQQGVVVSVTSYPSGAPATIYSGNGTGAYTGNSVTTNNLGYYEYYVPSGRYTKTFSIAGAIYETIQDLLEFDPADGTIPINQNGGSIGNAAVTGGSFNGSITNNATVTGGTYNNATVNLADAGNFYATKTVEAALQDLGPSRYITLEQFGGGTGVSDNTSALNSAVAALAAGGILQLRAGTYLFTSTMVLDNKQGIIVRGYGGATSGGSLPTQIRFSMGASVDAISAQSSSGVKFINCSIEYTNAAFNGNVINFLGSNFPGVEGCYIAGLGGPTAAASLIKITNTSGARIISNNLQFAVVGIKGRTSTSDFLNACTIEDNRFNSCSTNHIQDIQSGKISANWFEALTGGGAGSYADTFEDIGGGGGSSLVVEANWSGDVSAGVGGTQWAFRRRTPVTFIGNEVGFNTNGTGLSNTATGLTQGWVVKGNEFSAGNSNDVGVDFSGASNSFEYDIDPNSFSNVVTQYKLASSVAPVLAFKILQTVVTPEQAGALGNSPAADTAAWQTILADPRRIECFPNRVYQINTGLITSFRKRIHMNGATLQASSAMTHLFTNAVNQLVMCDGTLDGNSLVTDCLTFNGGGNSVFEAMTFKKALRDTVWFGTTGVNDQVLFNTCFAQQAGTTYSSLTCSTTAASATVTLSGTPNALVRVGDFIVITGAGGGYGTGNIHVITGISGATLTLDNSNASLVPANTVTNAACSIYSGSGWHFTHGTDSNLAILQNCNSSNTAACGAQDESLYGHRNINTDHQAALIGTSVGLLGTATTSNVYLAPPYYEQSSLTLDVLYQQGNNLKIDSAVLPTMTKFAYTPGNVFALSWQFQNGNNSLIRNYQEYVNAGTITLTDEQDMTFVQSGGAGNVTVKLPDAPYFADRPQVFNFNFAAVNGKTFTFTSTSSNATLINGVAGLTGVPFTPANYTSKKGVWSKNQNGWVIA